MLMFSRILVLILFSLNWIDAQILFQQSGARIYLEGVGVLSDYSQISKLISEAKGLWCEGDFTATGVFWRLPNGVIISDINATYPEYGIKVVSEFGNRTIIGLRVGLFRIDNASLLEGVYQCSALDVPREGSFTTINLWIIADLHQSLRHDQTICQFDALLPFIDTTAVLVYTEILQRPPTNIVCEMRNNRLETIGISRNILNRQSTTVTAVTIGLYVPVHSYPSEITCHFNYGVAGSSKFNCLLQEPYQSRVVITSIEKDEASSRFIVGWKHKLGPYLFSEYIVYIRRSDMSSVQISTNQTQLEIFGIEFDLIANKNLIVAAFSQSLERRAITLPAISIQDHEPCQPLKTFELEVRIEIVSKVRASEVYITRDEFTEIIRNLIDKTVLQNDDCAMIIEIERKEETRRKLPNITQKASRKQTKNERAGRPKTIKSNDRSDKTMSVKKKESKNKSTKKHNSSSSLKEQSKKVNKKEKATKKSTNKKKKPKKKKSKRYSDFVIDINKIIYIDFTCTLTCNKCLLVFNDRENSVQRPSRRKPNKKSKTPTRQRKSSEVSRLSSRKHTKKQKNSASMNELMNISSTINIKGRTAVVTVINQTSDTFHCEDRTVSRDDVCDCPAYCDY